MRLYITPKQRFAGTQAEARKLSKEEGYGPSDFDEIEVPTIKADLIDWLNKWSTGKAAPTDTIVDEDLPLASLYEPQPLPDKFKPAVEKAREQQEKFDRSISIDEILESADYNEASSIQYRATQRMIDLKVEEKTL